jgi:chromosome segregation ATPase
MGKAVLRFTGPIEGKVGKFAGIELLGDNAILGKNSGDVNGIHYFHTKKKGAGLFMMYDKLVSSIEIIESPLNKRLSLMPSPVKFNQTPSRSGTIKPNLNSTLLVSNSRTSVSPPALPTAKKSPPSDHELKRLKSFKAVIESERNDLLIENRSLKDRIAELENYDKQRNLLIKGLEFKVDEGKVSLEKANEGISVLELKLSRQRKSYEEQREELLEVIDQVEVRVNENEKVYITELRKLQEQLAEKQHEIENLRKSQEEANSRGDREELQGEFERLKSTNENLSKEVQQLQQKITEQEVKLFKTHKESLTLKETHHFDVDNMRNDFIKQLAESSQTISVKQKEINALRDEMKTLQDKNQNGSQNAVIDELNKKVHELKVGESKSEDYAKDISRLNKVIQDLEKKLDTIKPEDALYELEYKLENKERIIEDLRKELLSKDSNEAGGSVGEDATKLKKELAMKESEIIALSQTVKELSSLKDSSSSKEAEIKLLLERLDATQVEKDESDKELGLLKVKFRDIQAINEQSKKLLSERDNEIKELNEKGTKRDGFDETKGSLETPLQAKKNGLLGSKQETEETLKAQSSKISELEQVLESIQREKSELKDALALAQTELRSLKPDNVEKAGHNNTALTEALEEKTLEIELLKEELLELKSGDIFKEVEALKKVANEKNSTSATANKELNDQIQLLQDELKTRPTVSQLKELRAEMELIDELRKVESKSKDKEIYSLQEKINSLPSSSAQPHASLNSGTKKPNTPLRNSTITNRTSMSTMSLNRPSVISQIIDGELQVYIPEKKDAASGRDLWCGLCERDGHDSIDCPYENDVF